LLIIPQTPIPNQDGARSAQREIAFGERERAYWAARFKAIEFDPVPLKDAESKPRELKKPEKPLRARRKPSLARMIRRAELSGKKVASVTVDGVTLTFGEPAGGDDNNNNSWDEVLEHAPHAKRPS
jgi:hypothetical protein